MPTSSTRSSSTRTAASSAATTAARRGRKQSETNPRGSYYSQVLIDPNNDQRVWVHGAQMYYSEDGGKTFKTNLVQKIHGDYHAMWIDPRDSNHMIAGSDGGIYFTHDRGRTWDYLNTIAIGQFYEIGLDMQQPYHICGGLQDNNVWCGPSATFDTRGIANSDWFTVGGGDGFYAQIDPTDPNTVYAESQDGNLLRRNLKTHESRSIRPPAAEGERLRFQWNSPLVISAYDNKTIYYGGNYLFKSTDRGDTLDAPRRRSHHRRGSRQAADHGPRARQEHAVAPRRRAGVAGHHDDQRVADEPRSALGRHRRRQPAGHARRRQDVEERRRRRRASTSAASSPRASTKGRRTPRSTAIAATTSASTFS